MKLSKTEFPDNDLPLANRYKGHQPAEIPERYIIKRYGNKTGSYLLLVDDSRLWIDPVDNECLWFISG